MSAADPLTPDPPLAYTFQDASRPGFFADVWQRFFVQLNRFLSAFPQHHVVWMPVSKTFADSGYIASEGELVTVNATAGATTIKLVAAPMTGGTVIVKKSDASGNAVTVNGNGHTIDGAATKALAAQWNAATMTYTGTAWMLTASV
jgi:hypothetical protein